MSMQCALGTRQKHKYLRYRYISFSNIKCTATCCYICCSSFSRVRRPVSIQLRWCATALSSIRLAYKYIFIAFAATQERGRERASKNKRRRRNERPPSEKEVHASRDRVRGKLCSPIPLASLLHTMTSFSLLIAPLIARKQSVCNQLYFKIFLCTSLLSDFC